MARPKRLEMTALAGLALQLAFLVVCLILREKSGSLAVDAEMWHVAVGLLVWFLVLVHGRQRRLAQEEREERERLRATRLSDEIFEETELDSARASAGLAFFEKYLVPIVSLVLSGLLAFFAVQIARNNWTREPYSVSNPATVAIGMVFISFLGFLIGKYAAGIAQNRGFRLLRAGAGYTMGNVIVAVLTAVAMALYYFDIRWGERILTFVIPAVMALVALEVLLNLILDIYRPRVAGQETRPPYDSRLLGLFAEPEGVLKTMAATLDYQFGFKVSETWFYHFMERAILPLILVQAFGLWILTTLVVIQPQEVAFIETLGRPYVSAEDRAQGLKATLIQPGFRLKAPWPFAVTRRIPGEAILHVSVGKVYEGHTGMRAPIAVTKEPDIVLWRELHIDPREGFEASFLVPSSEELDVDPTVVAKKEGDEVQVAEALKAPAVNLVRVEGHVYYRLKHAEGGGLDGNAAFAYYYNEQDTTTHLEKLAFRAMCRVAASQDFLRWVAQDRAAVARQYLAAVQKGADQVGLGIEVVDATINAVHPPAEIARAYEQVVAALEQRESLIQEGEQESNRAYRQAEAESTEILEAATAYAQYQAQVTAAEAALFETQMEVYGKAPFVYLYRTYLDALELALENQRVYVVPDTAHEVQIIDLQEKVRPFILDDLDALED
ncbi:MAG: hypothetical protein GXY85_09785 [Candidatus Brocadiaceae bacterium]|nr:hypothetical protein [Candidatus Brocadiaceae bacterium]